MRRLSGLVSNILLLSRIENQAILSRKGKFRLDEQIRQAILALETKWTEKEINLEAEKGKEESLYHWYRKMIALRKSDEYSELFIYGSLIPVYEKTDGVIAYEREYQGRCVLVICNLKAAPQELPFGWNVKKILLSNHKDVNIEKEKICLRGYETVIADIEK